MDEVEEETALEERIVHAVEELLHVCAGLRLIEEVSALSDNHTNVRNGALVHEVRIVFCRPREVLLWSLQLSAVLTHPLLGPDEVPIRNQSAGTGLAEPHLGFMRRLADVPPTNWACGPGACEVGCSFAVLDCDADTTLQRRQPER